MNKLSHIQRHFLLKQAIDLDEVKEMLGIDTGPSLGKQVLTGAGGGLLGAIAALGIPAGMHGIPKLLQGRRISKYKNRMAGNPDLGDMGLGDIANKLKKTVSDSTPNKIVDGLNEGFDSFKGKFG